MERAPGQLLDKVWHDLTEQQRKDVAQEVAVHVLSMSQRTSTSLSTIDGFGVEQFKLVGGQPLLDCIKTPAWVPWCHPVFSKDSLSSHLQSEANMPPPKEDNEFVFYHPDLTSHNIFVHLPRSEKDKGQLAQIVDWTDAAFWPRFWVATCPNRFGPFTVPGADDGDWYRYLRAALEEAGFAAQSEWFERFVVEQYRLREERGGEKYNEWLRSKQIRPR